MAYTILQHLEYNAWANNRIAEAVSDVDNSLLFEERKSSFPSIAKTLLHVWDAEQIWINRMKGISLSQFPSVLFHGGKEELINGFRESSRELLSLIKEKGTAFVASSYHYTNLKGQPFTDTVEDTLFHIVNHGTYHRGQIITMLREAGVTKLPATDLIFFLRETRASK